MIDTLKLIYAMEEWNSKLRKAGLAIDISRQWTIGPPVLEIWWSCQISGGPDAINRQYLFVKSNTGDIIYLFLYKAFEQSLQYITFTEKDKKA